MFEQLEKVLMQAEGAFMAPQGNGYETWIECRLSEIARSADVQSRAEWPQYLATLPCAGCFLPNATCAQLCKHAQTGSAVSEGGGGGGWSGS